MIVSKWEIVHQDVGVEIVDVTDLLVAVFEPSEKTLKTVEQVRATEPLPLDSLGDHDDH